MQQARAIDNLVPPLAFVETLVRNFRRELDAAVACGKEAVDLHPGSPFGRLHYAEALEHAGRHEEALAEYRFAGAMSPCAPWVRAKGARFMAKTGRSAEALEILNELERRRESEHLDAYHMALLLHALGRRDDAFQELERAYVEKSYLTLLLDVDPKADSLRGDPRFMRFRDKVLVSAQSA
jgi:tetratricopeptide (TPR) repeat protein